MKKSRNIAGKVYPAAALTIFILVWELAVWLKDIPVYRLPAPSVIFAEFFNSFGLLMHHAGTTVMEASIGFLLGVALSVVFAVAMSMIKPLRQMFYPFMIISQSVPLIVVAPLLAIWFGFGLLPKIIMSVIVVFFPVTVSLTEGLGTFDQDLVDMMTVMRASRWQIYKTVRIPGALPSFFSGMKISAAYCVMGAVISEWTGASRGLGIYLSRTMSTFETAALFANIVMIVILSLVLFKIVDISEKIAIPWNRQ